MTCECGNENCKCNNDLIPDKVSYHTKKRRMACDDAQLPFDGHHRMVVKKNSCNLLHSIWLAKWAKTSNTAECSVLIVIKCLPLR